MMRFQLRIQKSSLTLHLPHEILQLDQLWHSSEQFRHFLQDFLRPRCLFRVVQTNSAHLRDAMSSRGAGQVRILRAVVQAPAENKLKF